jgi:hypothetical protein
VVADSGVVAPVGLELRYTTLDGCGYALREVRTPWWKSW